MLNLGRHISFFVRLFTGSPPLKKELGTNDPTKNNPPGNHELWVDWISSDTGVDMSLFDRICKDGIRDLSPSDIKSLCRKEIENFREIRKNGFDTIGRLNADIHELYHALKRIHNKSLEHQNNLPSTDKEPYGDIAKCALDSVLTTI